MTATLIQHHKYCGEEGFQLCCQNLFFQQSLSLIIESSYQPVTAWTEVSELRIEDLLPSGTTVSECGENSSAQLRCTQIIRRGWSEWSARGSGTHVRPCHLALRWGQRWLLALWGWSSLSGWWGCWRGSWRRLRSLRPGLMVYLLAALSCQKLCPLQCSPASAGSSWILPEHFGTKPKTQKWFFKKTKLLGFYMYYWGRKWNCSQP